MMMTGMNQFWTVSGVMILEAMCRIHFTIDVSLGAALRVIVWVHRLVATFMRCFMNFDHGKLSLIRYGHEMRPSSRVQFKANSIRKPRVAHCVTEMSSWDAWWQRKPQSTPQWRADGPSSDGGNWKRTPSGGACWESHPESGWAHSWQSSSSAPAASSTDDS
jgi:hypothetical protein